MTVALWRIATDAPDYEAHDLAGTGAKITGGRWNRVGRAVVYAATTPALACLETVVHLGAASLPLNRYLVRIDVPDALWAVRERLEVHALPLGWNAIPAGKVSLDAGDAWIAAGRTALLEVPSAIVWEESNVLVNPAHPQAGALRAAKVRQWLYDSRLRSAP